MSENFNKSIGVDHKLTIFDTLSKKKIGPSIKIIYLNTTGLNIYKDSFFYQNDNYF